MEKLQLSAQTRDIGANTKLLRKTGWIPAEIYGKGQTNVHLAVNSAEFEKVFRRAGESTIIELHIHGNGTKNVLIHEVQRDVTKSHPIHADFYEVSMTEEITATVELQFTGEAPAVKISGGTLVKVQTEVTVKCLAANLPHTLEVDISGLVNFSDAILTKDIPLPPGVELLGDMEDVVAKVQPPRDVEAEMATVVEEDVTKVEGVVKPETVVTPETEKK